MSPLRKLRQCFSSCARRDGGIAFKRVPLAAGIERAILFIETGPFLS